MKQIMLPENCPEEYVLKDELFHHVVRVLRYREGKQLQGLDKSGKKYDIVIQKIYEDRCILSVRLAAASAQQTQVYLYQCLPKGKKIETIIRSACELGVNRIIPVRSKNTIPPLPDQKKLDRWEKICSEAMQQSGSSVYSEIGTPVNVSDIPGVKENESGIVFHQAADRNHSLRSVLQQDKDRIIYLIGPEGGFAENEIASLNKKGYISVLMVNNILKVDTAAIAAAGIIRNILLEKET